MQFLHRAGRSHELQEALAFPQQLPVLQSDRELAYQQVSSQVCRGDMSYQLKGKITRLHKSAFATKSMPACSLKC